MEAECNSKQLQFEGFGNRKVVGSFDGGALTSDGGALLLREADRAIGLSKTVANCFRDECDQTRVLHTCETLIAQRVHGIALGYEDLNDHDELRHDPVLGLLSDPDAPSARGVRGDVAALSGKSTLNRLEHMAGNDSRYHKFSLDEAAMEHVFLTFYLAAFKSPPKRIILDLDATDDRLHGNQEGRFFHGYYRCYCYLPLYIFADRHLLCSKLRKANIDAAAGAKEELERIVTALRKAWPEVEIWVRADSGFARDDLMTWCENNNVEFVLGLAKNARLKEMIADEAAEAEAQFKATEKAARVFKDLEYRTMKSWSAKRRVVAKAEHLAKGANPRFVVTSLKAEAFPAKELYETIYCARGEMENRIKECQLDLMADRTSAKTLKANQLRLWFASLGYVLVEAVRRLGLEGTELAKATAGTIRLKLFKIAALVTKGLRRIKIAFASACPLQYVFAKAHARLLRAGTSAPPDMAPPARRINNRGTLQPCPARHTLAGPPNTVCFTPSHQRRTDKAELENHGSLVRYAG